MLQISLWQTFLGQWRAPKAAAKHGLPQVMLCHLMGFCCLAQCDRCLIWDCSGWTETPLNCLKRKFKFQWSQCDLVEELRLTFFSFSHEDSIHSTFGMLLSKTTVLEAMQADMRPCFYKLPLFWAFKSSFSLVALQIQYYWEVWSFLIEVDLWFGSLKKILNLVPWIKL